MKMKSQKVSQRYSKTRFLQKQQVTYKAIFSDDIYMCAYQLEDHSSFSTQI